MLLGALPGTLLCTAFAAHAQTGYRVGASLPIDTPYAINNAGSLVGEMSFQEGAVLYANGVLTDLTPRGPGSGAAYGINNAGTVVGTAAIGGATLRAFVYRNGVLSPVDPTSTRRSDAYDINASGQIVGWGVEPDGGDRGFVYDRGTLQYLNGYPGSTRSHARAINNRGQIVGEAEVSDGLPGPDPEQAFIYENGVMRPLDGIGGFESRATDINEAGQIVGASFGGAARSSAFLYDGGRVTEIVGAFGGDRSYADGINNRGQMVGFADDATGNQHGFLYDRGVLTDLSAVTEGWDISRAYDINDSQQIVATGCREDGGGCFTVRLDPIAAIPEPAHWAMLGVGAVLSGMLARRRRAGLR
jgi:probable HAF family extracellular repeat protein